MKSVSPPVSIYDKLSQVSDNCCISATYISLKKSHSDDNLSLKGLSVLRKVFVFLHLPLIVSIV